MCPALERLGGTGKSTAEGESKDGMKLELVLIVRMLFSQLNVDEWEPWQ